MLSVEKFKELLGDVASKLSEDQILELRDHQEKMAEVFFCQWYQSLEKKKNEKLSAIINK